MKKIFLLALFIGAFNINAINAQNFKGHVSGEIGFLNFKVRAQYELPVGEMFSTGINCNVYFINFVGPSFEPFFRAYLKKHGNEKGFFGQAKFIYGNLSNPNDNSRFNTFGFGIGGGYKFLIGNHFTIEPILGYRFVSPPATSQSQLGKIIGFYATTGLPLDFQLKFGYQF